MFLSKNHREALAHLLYGINHQAGFIALTGEAGTGKTAVLRAFLDRLGDDGYRTALMFTPCLSPLELLRSVNQAYGIPGEGGSRAELLDRLNEFLLEQKAAGRVVVLVVDDAQNLNPEVLEHVRLLSNLETETAKLIHIVLAGQPGLESLLARTELRQLKQRISIRYHLLPMDLEDTKGYLAHRLKMAGGEVAVTHQALKRIHRYSRGVPRLIDSACDQLVGSTEEIRTISAEITRKAVRNVKGNRGISRFPVRLRPSLLLALSVLAAAGIYLFPGTKPDRHVTPPMAQPVAVVSADNAVGTLRRGFHGMGEAESAHAAFNALAGLWKVNAAPTSQDQDLIQGLESLARQRGLQLATFNGSLDLLLRGNAPAILEFTVPGQKGRCYLALIGRDQDRWLIKPSLAGQGSLTSAQLKALWSGRGYLLWKNFYYIRPLSHPGSRGWRIIRLQQLLSRSGVYQGQPSGVFDAATVAALKKYQTSRGLEPDGKLGALTLPLLYNDSPEFDTPRLGKTEKVH